MFEFSVHQGFAQVIEFKFRQNIRMVKKRKGLDFGLDGLDVPGNFKAELWSYFIAKIGLF